MRSSTAERGVTKYSNKHRPQKEGFARIDEKMEKSPRRRIKQERGKQSLEGGERRKGHAGSGEERSGGRKKGLRSKMRTRSENNLLMNEGWGGNDLGSRRGRGAETKGKEKKVSQFRSARKLKDDCGKKSGVGKKRKS